MRATAMKAMASLRWSTAPRSGTRQCAIQDLGVDLHHPVKVFDQFAGWMVLREASISSVVPPLGHIKHTKGQSGARSACKSFVSALLIVFSAPDGVFNATDSLENPAVCGPEQRSMAQKN